MFAALRDKAADHQILLALAMLRRRARAETARFHADVARARTPRNWRKAHGLVDQANRALRNLN